MDNFDESAFDFVKAKAVEAVAELLEMRTNANGLVFSSLGGSFLVAKDFLTLYIIIC